MSVKVLVSDPIIPKGLERLTSNPNFQVDFKIGLKPDELLKIVSEYEVLLVRSETKVNAQVLAAAKKLKFVGRAGAGVDNIDLPEATKHGVVVTNVPGGNTIAAAEHTFALILAMARNLPQAMNSLKQGEWKRSKFVGIELYEKTLSVLGLGKIGKEVAQRALAFGMQVLVYDPFISQEYAQRLGMKLVSLEESIKEADFITLHLPLNDQTRNLISKEKISLMKKGVFIVNCARGGIINETDLVEALKSGQVRSAALDVFEKEPLPADNFLIKVDENLILTPHLGASTEEAQEKVAWGIAETVIDYFEKGIVRNTVNLPPLEPREKLEPYLNLVEKLGLFVAQSIEGGIQEVQVEYYGEVTQYNLAPVTVGVLKGILSSILDTEVNLVNANVLARERGIKVTETKSTQVIGFTNLVTVAVCSDKEKMAISGTLFSDKNLRIVKINQLDLDIEPEGNLLVLKNMDKPGVIGYIGTVLGSNQVNIGSMDVGRKDIGGEAITIVNVDSSISNELLNEIRKYPGITQAKLVKL